MNKILLSGLLVLIVSPLFSQIFYYPFNDGNTDNQVNNDFSTIIAQQTSPTTDVLGNASSALSFSGSSPQIWVNSGDLIDFGLTTSFSFVTDFYSNSAEDQDLFRDLLANGNGWQVGIYNNTGYITFEAGTGGTSISIRTESIYNDGDWHQLALIVNKDALTVQMYIDGIPSDLTAEVCGVELSGSEISIEGCNFNANEDNTSLTTIGEDLLGGMDEVSLYSTVLGLEDIQTNYASSFIGQAELATPLNNSEGINPVGVELEWETFTSAISYEIEYDLNVNFPTPVLLTSVTNTVNTEILEIGTEYFWRVKAITDLGTSLNSSIWSFETQEALSEIPSLDMPFNSSASLNPSGIELSWDNLNGALSYALQYDTNMDFSTAIDIEVGTTNYLLPVLAESTTYYWRVQGVNDVSDSDFSETWSLSTASQLVSSPVLSSPASGATDVPFVNLLLTWNSMDGAENYILEYSQSNSFLSPASVSVEGTSSTIELLIGSTTYYWRVKAENSIGSSPYSDVWSFTTEVNSSIEEITSLSYISLYPNPVKDQVTLELSDTVVNLWLFDISGKEVVFIKAEELLGKNKIDLAYLNSGLYTLRVEFRNGFQTLEFIKE